MLKSPDETVPPQEEAIHRDALGILLRRMRKKNHAAASCRQVIDLLRCAIAFNKCSDMLLLAYHAFSDPA